MQQSGALQPAIFKNELLRQVDVDDDGAVHAGSDRRWAYRPAGTWYVSQLHVEGVGAAARLVADLDRP